MFVVHVQPFLPTSSDPANAKEMKDLLQGTQTGVQEYDDPWEQRAIPVMNAMSIASIFGVPADI